MANDLAKPEWNGVIRWNSSELSCRLFSTEASDTGLIMVHATCDTDLAKAKRGSTKKIGEENEAEEDSDPAPALMSTLFCATCNDFVPANEVAYAQLTKRGKYRLTAEDLNSLKPKSEKAVKAVPVSATQPVLRALGFGRRLYVLPNPGNLELYATILRALRLTRTVGFIERLVIGKKAYAGILRPLLLPALLFGETHELLVFEGVNDTSLLKDPKTLRGYFQELPSPAPEELGKYVEWIRMNRTPLDLEKLIAPRRAALRAIAERHERSEKNKIAAD